MSERARWAVQRQDESGDWHLEPASEADDRHYCEAIAQEVRRRTGGRAPIVAKAWMPDDSVLLAGDVFRTMQETIERLSGDRGGETETNGQAGTPTKGEVYCVRYQRRDSGRWFTHQPLPATWEMCREWIDRNAGDQIVILTIEPVRQANEGSAAPQSSGIRHDSGKPRYDLIPPEAIRALAEVLGHAVRTGKYPERNWELGMDWSRCYRSGSGHLLDWWSGQDLDPESKLPHLEHALTNIAFLVAYEKRRIGRDNRPGGGTASCG